MKKSICGVAVLAAFVGPSFSAQDIRDSDATLIGDWRGTSVCQVRGSSCQDETSLYHIAHISEKPNWFSLKGDKIVDGKPITMGTVECRRDSGKSDLTCDLPKGVLHFTIQGNKMKGTITLPDGTLWRKLNLMKAPVTKMSD
jgi:hypothetical protein